MPFYTRIDAMHNDDRQRTSLNLLKLRQLFEEGSGVPGEPDYVAPIPNRDLSSNLIIATWNLREFGGQSYGIRGDEPLQYIAEIISRFDIVAIQEARKDTGILDRLRRFLGEYEWDYIVTDETSGRAGNSERLAIFFDRRKVRFTGLVGEVVLPPVDNKPVSQFARTPLLVGFQSGWFKFTLCTAHIIYGTSEANNERRIEEIDALAKHLRTKMLQYRKLVSSDKIKHSEYENTILLGDFNIFSVEDETFKALIRNGWYVTKQLLGAYTNVGKKKKSFDQIAFMSDAKNVEATGRCGVFNFFKLLYLDERQSDYVKLLNELPTYAGYDTDNKRLQYYRRWRTHQMSDHLPMWLELKIDFSGEYLERRADISSPS